MTGQMQTELTNAESDLTNGANDCVQGANNGDSAQLNAAANLFGSATTLITQIAGQLG
jgi:hypothetical protein